MSDNLDNRELRRLKQSDQGGLSATDAERTIRMDQRLQAADQPAIDNRGDQKLTDEQQQLATLHQPGEPQSIEAERQFQYLQDRVALERELEKPPNPNFSAETQRAHEAALLHEIAVLKQQHANDALANQATTSPAEAPSFQPAAIGERAMAERAESGPEKKDKDIYLAENRLSKL